MSSSDPIFIELRDMISVWNARAQSFIEMSKDEEKCLDAGYTTRSAKQIASHFQQRACELEQKINQYL